MKEREIGVVTDGRIRKCYLCFTYTPVSTVSFLVSWSEYNEREREVPKFCVNSLSIVYHCAIHNPPALTQIS